jgi:integrase
MLFFGPAKVYKPHRAPVPLVPGVTPGVSNMGLTVKQVEALTAAGRYGCGDNLYLQILPTGGRTWLMRYEVNGRERWHGLGSAKDFKLVEARERCRKARQGLRDGIDPIDARKAARAARAVEAAKNKTFEQVTQEYFDLKKAEWANPEHHRQFLATMKKYAYPVLGRLPVAVIDTPLVLKVVRPIWHTKTSTADRVRRRIEAVLTYATASKFRAGDNPAAWEGHLDALLPSRTKITTVKHHPAMNRRDLPDFMAKLKARDSIEARALEFLILAASRTGEVIGAQREEIDLDDRLWIIPASRMKNKKHEHRVPLTDRAIKIFKSLPVESDFVFPGAWKDRGLGKNALTNLLNDLGYGEIVVHGFRSTFRDWAGEDTAFAPELAEAALSHSLGGKVQLAYQRGTLLQKRRKLMDAWERFCYSPPSKANNVTPIRKAARS